ncbi:MAG: hypothetical protein KJ571_18455, partial [Bacteroidetes bacterium]|nr:hypothetical protein [Bacteroidota bacterium]
FVEFWYMLNMSGILVLVCFDFMHKLVWFSACARNSVSDFAMDSVPFFASAGRPAFAGKLFGSAGAVIAPEVRHISSYI